MEDFAGKEVEPIYMAATLREAKRVEEVLTRQGVEYAVKIEPFVRYLLLLIPRRYSGATFYVFSGQSSFCRRALAGAGLSAGLINLPT